MTVQPATLDGDLFNDALIKSYLDDNPRFLERGWLWRRVKAALDKPSCRLVLLTAEPGAGKTAFMAWIARQHPNWPCYFIRRDQRTPIEDGGWRGFLEKTGFQLAARYPEAFQTDAVRLSISQVVDTSSGQVTGADIDRLVASPFYAKAIQISQQVKDNKGSVTGIRVRELVTDPSRISLLDLQRMALLAPARSLSRLGSSAPIVILIDALDELRYRSSGDTVLDWLTQCPELPANLRILVTSRPDQEWLAALRSAQQERLEQEEIPDQGEDVRNDLTSYASKLTTIPSVRDYLMKKVNGRSYEQVFEAFKDRAVEKAGGNLGYLDALGRSVDQAVKRKDGEMLTGLLDLDSLPDSMEQLFAHFLNLIWQKVQDRSVAIKDPRTRKQHYLELWPAVYRPILGVLTVAREMLAVEQIRQLGGIPADSAEVAGAISLLRQFLDSDGARYRFYHASLPEALTAARSSVDGELARFAIDPADWHAEIIASATKVSEGGVEWKDCSKNCDPYLLRHLIPHIQAVLASIEIDEDRQYWAEAAYAVILDVRFRDAQQRVLGDLSTTLADLRNTLSIALERDDLVKALECAGVYRHIKHGLTVTSKIFEAVQSGDLGLALQRSRHYEVLPGFHENWGRALQLYLAWDAAERGNAATVRQIMDTAEPFLSGQSAWIEGLWDALLVRTARALARNPGDGRNASAWLAELAPGCDTEVLLKAYDLAQPDPADRIKRAGELRQKLAELKKFVDEGDPEAISAPSSLNEEDVGQGVADLGDLLVALAGTPEGLAGIDQTLGWLLPNPYPRYRDIGLVAVGVACLAIPEAPEAFKRLQDILEVALNREGITFTYCLPAVLLQEAQKRGVPFQGLDIYFNESLAASNRWGTAMRAHSARAAGLCWQNKNAEAVAALEEASRQDTGLAGYGTLTLLSLANRCYEFGIPERAFEPIWGWGHDTSLVSGAAQLAKRVRDRQFRRERIRLVKSFCAWSKAATPDVQTARDTLAGMTDPDVRGLYIDHVTARWASQETPNIEAVKKLVLPALPRATALDTVLARLFGPTLAKLSDDELAEALRLSAAYLKLPMPQW